MRLRSTTTARPAIALAVVALALSGCGSSDDGGDKPVGSVTEHSVPSGRLAFPPPSSYPRDTPDRTLAAFLAAWRGRDWSGMLESTAPSWREEATAPRRALAALFTARPPLGYAVRKRSVSPGNARYEVVVERPVRGSSGRGREALSLNLLRENRRGMIVASGGAWGVDPRSVTSAGG
jgi:hypothetical protein